MNIDLSKVRIFIRPGKTDLRKAINGLAAIVENKMRGELFSGNVYLFCSKGRSLVKGLWWDKTGFWLCQKRLEQDKFPWPQDETQVRELTVEQLQMLLEGIDFFKAHKELYYKKVS